MIRKRALYSVLQYIPDGGRAEGANAGVAIFLPEYGQVVVRTSPNLARIKKFFTPTKQDLQRIELALKACEHRLQVAQSEFSTDDDFCKFVAARADAIRLTPPRLVVLTDLGQKLDELYLDLVGDVEHQLPAKTRGPVFPPRVAEIFGRLEAARKVWKPGKIIVPESHSKLEVPLAYQNGRVNYVLPQSLTPSEKPESRLPKLGFNGFLIHQHKIDDTEGKLVVLSTDAKTNDDIERRFEEVLDDFKVRFVRYSQAVAFAEEVEREAH